MLWLWFPLAEEKKLHHYQTLKALLSILNNGYRGRPGAHGIRLNFINVSVHFARPLALRTQLRMREGECSSRSTLPSSFGILIPTTFSWCL